MERTSPSYDILICGTGILGASTAYHLATLQPNLSIAMIDIDVSGTFSSSERNGGGVRAFWTHSINRKLCLDSIAFFKTYANDFGFHPCGYLWFHPTAIPIDDEMRKELTEAGYPIRVYAPCDTVPHIPWPVHHQTTAMVTFHPEAGIINANRVRAWFLEQTAKLLSPNRFRIHSGWALKELEPTNEGGWKATCHSVSQQERQEFLETALTAPKAQVMTCTAKQVVLACGAWTHHYTKPFSSCSYTCKPIARHIAIIDAPAAYDVRLPMVITPDGVYLHPEGGYLLTGYAIPDQPPGIDFTYDAQVFFEDIVWPKLYAFSDVFETCKHIRGWAGMYSYSPDQDGILGYVGDHKTLFQIHSFTGRGVMISPAAGRGLSELMMTGDFQTLDLTLLSEKRFAQTTSSAPETFRL